MTEQNYIKQETGFQMIVYVCIYLTVHESKRQREATVPKHTAKSAILKLHP